MSYQVLIVDDEEIVCRGLAQFVKWELYGFEVTGTAGSVDEALTFMKKNHVDLVFMDIRMPEKTGLDMLKILRQDYPNVKSVILSGYSDFTYAQEAIRGGAVDYLTKPVVLSDIETLLERLSKEFSERRKETRIHSNRMEALLLSAAKGYAQADSAKFNLPRIERWYGLSMVLKDKKLTEDEISAKKEHMRIQISSVVPSAIFLDDEIFSLFCLLPWESDSAFGSLTSLLEQLCTGLEEWSCGASKQKYGLKELHQGWEEACRAQRYHRAGTNNGIVLYQNIEPLFVHSSKSLQDILPEFFSQITNPETRSLAPRLLNRALISLQEQNLTLTQYQTACISFLIELNSFLKNLSLKDEELHAGLNRILYRILLSETTQDSAACMTEYLEWLIHLIEQVDERSLGKDVIREIQLFIRRHYAENISLNSLAERFYLHPNYLSRLFKEKTGHNFVEYLTEVRMEKVKELLRTSDKKITEICEMTGYDNPRYFSKVFKQYTGVTPREYREMKPENPETA